MIRSFAADGPCRTLARSLFLHAAASLLAQILVAAQVDVLTQHNDNARTGANLREKTLTAANVRSGFGKIGEPEVDGDIYAQPLYISKAHLNYPSYRVQM
jgi:hypothetical protein